VTRELRRSPVGSDPNRPAESELHTRWCRPSWAKCQHTSLMGQALCGSRFFDLRIYVKQRTFWGEKKLRAGHYTFFEGTSGKEPSFGAYGGSLISLVYDAVKFVTDHTSEFLILRFSHVKNHQRVRDGIHAQLSAMNAFTNGKVYTGGQANLGTQTVTNLKGHVIMVFDSEFGSVRTGNHRDWMVPWAKLEENDNQMGLHTCGVFKGSTDITTVLGLQQQAISNHITHVDEGKSLCHLCCIYWQQTGEVGKFNVKEMTTAPTGSAHSVLPAFVVSLLTAWGKLGGAQNSPPPANVISHDYVTPNTCENIVKMNPVYWGHAETTAVADGARQVRRVNL
jgi:hypothetical protein